MDCSPPGSSVPGDSPGKNTGASCHALLQGIFPTQGSNQDYHIAGRSFTVWATREAQEYWTGSLSLLQGVFLTQELNQGLMHCRPKDSLPTEILLRADLVKKNRTFSVYFKMATFPSSSRNTRGFFSDHYCENLIGLLEVKLLKVWGPPLTVSPSEVFISHTCPQPLAICQLAFPTLALFPRSFLPLGFWFSVTACLSLQFSWQWFILWPQFSDGSKKSCWFSVCLAFCCCVEVRIFIDWYWSWNSNTLTTWCKELTHWKRPWCWERLKAEGEGDGRGWDGWMASLTRWTWVWANSGNWWWTGKPVVLQSLGSQRVSHDWMTELTGGEEWLPSSLPSGPEKEVQIMYFIHLLFSVVLLSH